MVSPLPHRFFDNVDARKKSDCVPGGWKGLARLSPSTLWVQLYWQLRSLISSLMTTISRARRESRKGHAKGYPIDFRNSRNWKRTETEIWRNVAARMLIISWLCYWQHNKKNHEYAGSTKDCGPDPAVSPKIMFHVFWSPRGEKGIFHSRMSKSKWSLPLGLLRSALFSHSAAINPYFRQK